MIVLLLVLLIVISIILIAQPNKTQKLAGKIILGIILVPILGFILLFATCLVMMGVSNIH